MSRRRKYHLLRWCEEIFAGVAFGGLLLTFFIDAMAGACWPLIAAILTSAVSYMISFECGCAARKMRRKRKDRRC